MGPRSYCCDVISASRGRRWRRTALQEARFQAGLTLKEAAGDIGISIPYLKDLEVGRSDPSLRVALRVSRFYGLHLHQLWLEEAAP
jgi:DNA-binding XRE family transcriptional regulator